MNQKHISNYVQAEQQEQAQQNPLLGELQQHEINYSVFSLDNQPFQSKDDIKLGQYSNNSLHQTSSLQGISIFQGRNCTFPVESAPSNSKINASSVANIGEYKQINQSKVETQFEYGLSASDFIPQYQTYHFQHIEQSELDVLQQQRGEDQGFHFHNNTNDLFLNANVIIGDETHYNQQNICKKPDLQSFENYDHINNGEAHLEGLEMNKNITDPALMNKEFQVSFSYLQTSNQDQFQISSFVVPDEISSQEFQKSSDDADVSSGVQTSDHLKLIKETKYVHSFQIDKIQSANSQDLQKLSLVNSDSNPEEIKEKNNPFPGKAISFSIDSKCKMDVGYKKFLRCARKALKTWFNSWCPTNNSSRYKWNKKPNKAQIWYDWAHKFLVDNKIISMGESTKISQKMALPEQQIWALVILLQPTLSSPIYQGAKRKHGEKNSVIDDKLGDEGILLFRGIFDKNTHEQVKSFFSQQIIVMLWPGILNHFTEQLYNDSQNNNQNQDGAQDNAATSPTTSYSTLIDFLETNCKITKQFDTLFNLGLPQWWLEKYPAAETSLQEKRLRKFQQKRQNKYGFSPLDQK